jgi:hypothetical protein
MFSIYIRHYHYHGTIGAPKDDYLKDDDGNVLRFGTIEEANAYAHRVQPGENYRLQMFEYAPPLLQVVKWHSEPPTYR